MARSPEASDSEWEKVEAEEAKAKTDQVAPAVLAAPTPPASPAPASPAAPPASERDEVRSEDNFEMVECASAGDASCESDGEGHADNDGMDTPRRQPSEDGCPEDVGTREVPRSPSRTSEVEDAEHTLHAVEKSGSDHSDGSSTTADEGRARAADEEPALESYRCAGCDCLVFKETDVESSQYHAQTSPGYLLKRAYNFEVTGERETVKYTTGVYEIQHVVCKRCSKPWGITYTDAHEQRNKGKVGKFLIGCDRLVLPKGTVHPLMVERSSDVY